MPMDQQLPQRHRCGECHRLEAIMEHYAEGPFDFDEHPLTLTAVIRVVVERMSGKRSKH